MKALTRRFGAVAFFVAVAATAAPRLATQAVRSTPSAVTSATPSPLVSGVEAVGMTVADMERSVAFFSDVLTFQKVSDVETSGPDVDRLHGVFASRLRVVRMRLGEELLELTEYLAPRGRPVPQDSRSNDRWFQHVAIIVSNMDLAYARLREHRVEHSSPEPQRLPDWNPNAGGIKAFYFKDPDGHPLEILQFPAAKGDSKWQQTNGRLFLGVDHTAIVVGDTAASLAFYRDLLGLRLAGESMNYGVEQERLNAVFGARLHISGLRAQTGPGVEFLEYLSPRDGRQSPDIKANDLAHWETTMSAPRTDRAFEALKTGRWLISPSVVSLALAGRTVKSFLVRDPDGHAVKLVASEAAPR